MNKELQDKLYKDFPKIFRQKDLSKMESCMYWGCDHGEGWHEILRNLCDCMQSRIDANPHLMEPTKVSLWNRIKDSWKLLIGKPFNLYRYKPPLKQIEFSQVKEKLGALRIYTHNSNDEFEGMIDFAEWLSRTVCEDCGKPGKLRSKGGWLRTTCDKCAKIQGFKEHDN